jgi:hypothetical protein
MPSGEIHDGDPKPNLLGLGLASSSVGDGGSSRWKGVTGRSLIVRSVVPLVKGFTVGDPFCSSVAGVMPSGGSANRPRSTCVLGV